MSQGANTLTEVDPMIIYSFFFDGIKRVRGRNYCNLVRVVLNRVEEESSSVAKAILLFLPSIKKGRKNYQFMTPGEAKKDKRMLRRMNTMPFLKVNAPSVGHCIFMD